jgi:hypothetical protein
MGFHDCYMCTGFYREIRWVYASGKVCWLQLARGKHYRIFDELQRVSLAKNRVIVLPNFKCCPIRLIELIVLNVGLSAGILTRASSSLSHDICRVI